MFSVSVSSSKDNTRLWHLRFGHMSIKRFKELQEQGVLGIKRIEKLDFCEDHALRKSTRNSFKKSSYTTKGILDYIHSNLWGSAKKISLSVNSYFLSIAIDLSRRVWVYVLKHKDHVLTGKKVKKIRTDNDLEFYNQQFDSYCANENTTRHKIVRLTP